MVGAYSYRQFFGDIPVRINHFIGAVAQQKFGMNITVCLADDIFCPHFFNQAGNLQTALEVGSDTDKANVEIPDTKAS